MTTPSDSGDEPIEESVRQHLWRVRARLVTPPDEVRAEADLDRLFSAAREHAHARPGVPDFPDAVPEPSVDDAEVVPIRRERRVIIVGQAAAAAVLLIAAGGVLSGLQAGVSPSLSGLFGREGGAATPIASDALGDDDAAFEGAVPDTDIGSDVGTSATDDGDGSPAGGGSDLDGSGDAGAGDSSGASGAAGDGDADGSAGSSGATGGSTGSTSGSEGAAGSQGSSGSQGPSGPSGSSGSSGSSGDAPATGEGQGGTDGDASDDQSGSSDGTGGSDGSGGDGGNGGSGGSSDAPSGDAPPLADPDEVLALPDPGSVDGFGGAVPCPEQVEGSWCLPDGSVVDHLIGEDEETVTPVEPTEPETPVTPTEPTVPETPATPTEPTVPETATKSAD